MLSAIHQPRVEPLIVRSFRIFFLVLTLLLVTQAAFIEPFQITTGSMAPLLVGVHRRCNCPKCGFPVMVGAPTDESPANHYDVHCPNCGQDKLGLDSQPDQPGQRILVDKSAFEFRSPRRWEVVVFRGPDDRATPFVKRVVGLPGETVQIKDGDVYINGELSRKPSTVKHQTRIQLFDPIDDEPGTKQLAFTDYWIYNGSKANRIENIENEESDDGGKHVYRSVHYQSAGRHGIATPYRLGADEYYMLGDNSAASDDSRFWPNPGVKHCALIGRVIYPRLASGHGD